MSEKDGGSAFPMVHSAEVVALEPGRFAATFSGFDGMSLKDVFALAALAGIMGSPQRDRAKPAANLAADCYAIADAMLKERPK